MVILETADEENDSDEEESKGDKEDYLESFIDSDE